MSDTTEDQDLAYTRSVRMRLVEAMTNGALPTDNRDRATLLMALNDISRDAINVKKIKSDEGIGNRQAEAQAIIAQLMAEPGLKKLGRVDVIEGQTRVIHDMPDDLVSVEILEDELSTSPSTEGYAEFMKRVG